MQACLSRSYRGGNIPTKYDRGLVNPCHNAVLKGPLILKEMWVFGWLHQAFLYEQNMHTETRADTRFDMCWVKEHHFNHAHGRGCHTILTNYKHSF